MNIFVKLAGCIQEYRLTDYSMVFNLSEKLKAYVKSSVNGLLYMYCKDHVLSLKMTTILCLSSE